MNNLSPLVRHPWRRFSLRAVFVALTVLCVVLAVAFNRARRQRSHVAAIISSGRIQFDYHLDVVKEPAQGLGPLWLELFRRPVDVELLRWKAEDVDDAFVAKHVSGMRHLKSLTLACPRLTDVSLSHIARLRNLTTLRLYCPRITAAGVQQLDPLVQVDEIVSIHNPMNERAGHALTESTLIQMIEVGLIDVLEYLSDLHGVRFNTDDVPKAKRWMPVTLTVKSSTHSQALDLILEPTELGYFLDNGTIKITSREEGEDARPGLVAFRSVFPDAKHIVVDW